MQTKELRLTDWLPTTKKEVELRGWTAIDVILFSGDAYIDHPSFGGAVIGRVLEAAGYRVAIVPQPDWHGDYRDFRKLGRPRLFFGIAPGCMDSMVNKYTAGKRLRSEDAYSPDGRHDLRPEYPTLVYTHILKELFPDVPVVIGGIEASLRRLTHYDYWQNRLRAGILVESRADLLVYGMGEKPLVELCRRLDALPTVDVSSFQTLVRQQPITQTARLVPVSKTALQMRDESDIILHSHEACLDDKKKQAANFRHIEEESNRYEAARLWQQTGDEWTVVEPPIPQMTTAELDASFDLPYTRLPHPKYKGKRIAAYEMIKFSVNIHRGCFGGCSFCTISAHQGKFVVSRSEASILREVEAVTQMPDFKGYLSDLGGPSANMYRMEGKKKELCQKCRRPSCLFPGVCPNLNADHAPLLRLYQQVDAVSGVKKSFIGSGVRYDLLLDNPQADAYTRELITRHVSGRLKVAPEHTNPAVLRFMRKPPFEQFHAFKRVFDKINREANLRQQLVPYFISSHPACTATDMAELAAETKQLDFHLEQVQDFTPTPMTLSTEAFYAGVDPHTLAPLFRARTLQEKEEQRMFFFWYKPEERSRILAALKRMGRADLATKLYDNPSHFRRR